MSDRSHNISQQMLQLMSEMFMGKKDHMSVAEEALFRRKMRAIHDIYRMAHNPHRQSAATTTPEEYEVLRQQCAGIANDMMAPDFVLTDEVQDRIDSELFVLAHKMLEYDISNPLGPGEPRRLNAFEEFQAVYRPREVNRHVVTISSSPAIQPSLDSVSSAGTQASQSQHQPVHHLVVTANMERDARAREAEEANQELYDMMRRAYTQSYLTDHPMPTTDDDDDDEH